MGVSVDPGGALGYNEVAMIPAGATHIRVTDNSRNYLGNHAAPSHAHTNTHTYTDTQTHTDTI